jgi:ATP phosphoribosyltransferase regulatory subunit
VNEGDCMTNIKMFEKPLGMRDTHPVMYEKLQKVRTIGRTFLKQHGYQFMKTPTLEYYETIGKASAIKENALFKLVDSQGNTLVLRPDMTTPIARVATSKLLTEKIPQRLAYFASVYRSQQREGGRPAEFEQMGVELIGDSSVYADAEIIMTTVGLLKKLGIESFKVTVGHAGILQAVLEKNIEDAAIIEQVRTLLVDKNYVGVEQVLETLQFEKQQTLLAFIDGAQRVEDIRAYVDNEEAFTYMQTLEMLLTEAGVMPYVVFDYTYTSHMNYYTGMLFEVYAQGSGFPLGNGGRYDGLFENFGQQVGATGFGLRVDRLLEAIPAFEIVNEAVAIIYDAPNYKHAMEAASALREAGKQVTLQYKDVLTNEQQFITHYADVHYFVQGAVNE